VKDRLGTLLRRIIGVLLLVTGIAGIGAAVTGAVVGRRSVDQAMAGLNHALSLGSGSLETVDDTLLQTQATLSSVNDLVDTAAGAAAGLSETIEATGQSVDQISEMAAAEIPAILEALQSTVAELARAAGAIDVALDTMTLLTGGLVDFSAGVPDATPARELETSLAGLTRDVRGLATDLARVSQSVEPISRDAVILASDLSTINEDLRGFAPILDEYVAMIEDIREGLAEARASLPRLVRIAKLAITVLAVWLSALHLAPLVLGWGLVAKKRPGEAAIQRTSEPVSAPDFEDDSSDS